jgi:hypothetical protein
VFGEDLQRFGVLSNKALPNGTGDALALVVVIGTFGTTSTCPLSFGCSLAEGAQSTASSAAIGAAWEVASACQPVAPIASGCG